MRIGVVADIHGNLAALDAALEALRAAGIDRLACAGDLVGYGPMPNECVEVIAASGGTVLASTQTSTTGAYSVTVPASTQVIVRVKAELVKTGTPAWTVRARDNTSGNALYVLDSTAFSSGAVATLTRDLNAASGWSIAAAAYVGTRSAAPFALLDTAYQSMQLVLTADAIISAPSPRKSSQVE